MFTLEISVSDELARELRQWGLLEPGSIAAILKQETLRRRAADGLTDAMDKLAALNGEPMSEDEIQTEIRHARAAMRAARS